jgi:hypothetical protein
MAGRAALWRVAAPPGIAYAIQQIAEREQRSIFNMNTIDAALLAAIEASATTAPKPKRFGTRLVAVSFGDDDEPVRAAADKSQLVQFADYINTRAANL